MTLLETAQLHWRHYLPLWLFFPALFIAARYFNFPVAAFAMVAIPLFCAVSIWAMLPWLRHKVGFWPSLFWLILVPVSFWFLLVALGPPPDAA
jgi:hypothetical protein